MRITTILLIFIIALSGNLFGQNSPLRIWGFGLDGSTYQQTAIYSDTQYGLLFEAPLAPNGEKLPIKIGWRGGGLIPLSINGTTGNISIGNKMSIGTINAFDRGLIASNGLIENTMFRTNGSGHGLSGFAITARNPSNHEILESSWIMYTAAPDGGYGVGPRNYEIWEYPKDAQSRCCRPRLIIENSNGAGDYGTLTINRNGYLGIGVRNPSYHVDVNGRIRAKEIKVETNWGDFVFYEDYPLLPLSEVEKFIKENRHLPGIPSEKEVHAEGINLGEISSKLLQKIEELTLYVIEQNKTNQRLIKDMEELRKLNDKQNQDIEKIKNSMPARTP